MKFTQYFHQNSSLLNCDEYILSCKELSTSGTESFKIPDIKLPLTLDWDLLMTKESFVSSIEFLKTIDLTKFSAIRVKDPGAAKYIQINYPNLGIHLLADHGNHNIYALKTWQEMLGKQLKRIVISNELPKEKIQRYAKELSVDLEVYAFGPIKLFYSPRKLLSPVIKSKTSSIEVVASSTESGHKGLPVIENDHGTLMYYSKELSLIDSLEELQEYGVSFVRIDSRKLNQTQIQDISRLIENFDKQAYQDFKNSNPRPLIRGYYNKNKSNVLFSKLKNTRLCREDNSLIGQVVQVEKGKLVAIEIMGMKPTIGQRIRLLTPEGKSISSTIEKLSDVSGKPWTEGHLAVLNYRKGVIPKTFVYADSES